MGFASKGKRDFLRQGCKSAHWVSALKKGAAVSPGALHVVGFQVA